MKPISISVCFMLLAASVMGQQKTPTASDKQPYVLVDTFHVDMKSLVLSPAKIESVEVLKDANAEQTFGSKAKYGAVIVKTKPNTELLRIGDIQERYKVSETDRKLQVCINQTLVSKPELILIDPAEILSVEVISGTQVNNSGDPGSKEKFLNIKTNITEK